MGKYRTYADKNNVIISNGATNTGRNPIIELYYGNLFTRALIYFDLTELRTQVQRGQIDTEDNETKHKLRLYNTGSFDISKYLNDNHNIEYLGKKRAYSVTLEIHAITEDWDEGRGYDHSNYDYVGDEQDYNFIQGPSNWTDRKTETAWSSAGAISSGSTALGTVEFDFGKEHLEFDISDYINNLITSGATGNTYGFCIKWPSVLEEIRTQDQHYIGFFSRHTHTWFTPHIETTYDNVVRDDRTKFFINKTNRLYFYSLVNGIPTNLDQTPVCTVDDQVVSVTKQTTGIYYAEVMLSSSSGYTDYTQYQDVWSNLHYNGTAQPDVTLDFTTLPTDQYFKFSQSLSEPQEYGLGLSGIRRSQRLNQGNRYQVPLTVRKPYVVNDSSFLGDVYYRLYIRQGAGEVEVIPNTLFSYAYDRHYFELDTTWLVPQKYFVDVTVVQGGNSIVHKELLDFSVVSEGSI